jgi:DNA helicase HerA-like ATPase
MADSAGILVGKGTSRLELQLALANRHGLIAGATGTGKSVTLRVLAEGFAARGVPVFLADVKGDLAGVCQPGALNPKFAERIKAIGVSDFAFEAMPTVFWDLFGERGHPIRTTVSELGPLLLGRLLELNDVQAGVLNLGFKLADDLGLLLIDLKDLRALLAYMVEHAAELTAQYGNVSAASVGAIQRGLLALESQGGDKFFGEPALDLSDFMRRDASGRGAVNVLVADQLMMRPRLYATFLLWLLSELFEQLPEEGDLDRPKLVFFFDEAHLLFTDASPALVQKVEQVVRLIRSKGVGVYFVTQNPLDIPETVLGQLGNKVQHALRAFTPKDQKAVRAAAETFRANPRLDTTTAILELGVGEALVSLLDLKGVPAMVERALIAPPRSRLGTITPEERAETMGMSPVAGKYDTAIDRESAFEQLGGGGRAPSSPGPTEVPTRGGNPWGTAPTAPTPPRQPQWPQPQPRTQMPQWPGGSGRRLPPVLQGPATRAGASMTERIVKSIAVNMAGQVTRTVTNQIIRGILGSLKR